MAIEFSIASKDFVQALKPFFAGRARGKSAELDFVDIKAEKREVEFVSTGLSSSVKAEVVSSGCARVPYLLFETLFRKPERLAAGSLAVRIQAGEIKAGPTTFDHRGITIQTKKSRVADLPIDASLLDTLALSFRFSTKELTDSGLRSKVEASRKRTDRLIDRAAKIVAPLEITCEDLRRVAFDRAKRRAAENR